jgi:type II secretory pathway component PulF
LAAECDAFAAIAIGLVRAGERGAGLTAALNQAGAHQEREAETAARIRSALAYPLLLATVGSASVALITLFVVPRFAALLGDLGQSLPPATRVLIAVSHFVRHYGILLGALVVGLAVGVTRVIIEHRSAWHAWLLRLPLIGPIRHALATARATRTLGALLGTGTSALTALDIARDAVGDAAIARRLLEAKSRVAEGSGLARAFEDTRALTPTALQLAAIGDQAGRLPTMLAKAAEMEEQEAERRLKTLVSFIEPALILVFAGLVAFVAAALLQAVYSLRPGGA